MLDVKQKPALGQSNSYTYLLVLTVFNLLGKNEGRARRRREKGRGREREMAMEMESTLGEQRSRPASRTHECERRSQRALKTSEQIQEHLCGKSLSSPALPVSMEKYEDDFKATEIFMKYRLPCDCSRTISKKNWHPFVK